MKVVFDLAHKFCLKTPAWLVLQIFTLHLFAFIWLDYLGIKEYPEYFTTVYIWVCVLTSASNLLNKSRWLGMR